MLVLCLRTPKTSKLLRRKTVETMNLSEREKKIIWNVSLPLCSLKHTWHLSTKQTKGKKNDKMSVFFLLPALFILQAELLLLSPSQGNTVSIWLKNYIICHKSVPKSLINITLCTFSITMFMVSKTFFFQWIEVNYWGFGTSHSKNLCNRLMQHNFYSPSGLHLVMWNCKNSSKSNFFYSTDITAAFSERMTGNRLWHFQGSQIYPVWLQRSQCSCTRNGPQFSLRSHTLSHCEGHPGTKIKIT